MRVIFALSELEISRFLTIYGSNMEIEKSLVIMEKLQEDTWGLLVYCSG
jgi:hypothetical protein